MESDFGGLKYVSKIPSPPPENQLVCPLPYGFLLSKTLFQVVNKSAMSIDKKKQNFLGEDRDNDY